MAATKPASDEPKAPPPPPFVIVRSQHQKHYLKALIYGAYGVGKTSLAATAMDVDEMNDILFLDMEAGSLVLPEGMDVIRIKAYSELARVKDYLRLHCRYRDAGNLEKLAELESNLRGEPVAPEDVKQYRTLIVDSLTEAQQYLMYQLLSISYESQPLDYEPDSVEGKDWQRSSEMIQLLVRTLRDLPMHVIFVCSEKEVETGSGDSKRLLKRPELPGKLGGKVQGFLTVVGYLEVAFVDKQTKRRLWLQQGHPRFQAKMRVRKELQATAPRYIDEPSIGELLELSRRLAPRVIQETETDASTESTDEADSSSGEANAENSAPTPPSGGARGRLAARRAGRPVRGGSGR